jgi:capsular polysaccharide biosynthesis protein
LVAVAVLLASVVAYALSSFQPKTYEGKATLIVGQSLSGINPDYNQLLVSQRLSQTYASVATTTPILAKVIDKLGLKDTPGQLADRVSATAAADSALLTITARAGNPAGAATLANALAEELIGAAPAAQGSRSDVVQSIDDDLAAIRKDIRATQAEIDSLSGLSRRTAAQEVRLQTLQTRIATLRSTFASLVPYSSLNASNLLTVVQPALPADTPSAPRPLLNAMLGGLIGFLLASAIALIAQSSEATTGETARSDQTA